MDNKKIGKLIAELRRKQGLTQQELGDKVGVGFRAVSKWERGINLPDIGIINHLSKTLGISSDELLSGEIKVTKTKDNKKKTSKTIKMTIILAISIITIFLAPFIYYNNKTYVYGINKAAENNYFIDGQVSLKGKEMNIIINSLNCEDTKLMETKIKNYQYDIFSGENHIFGYGQDPNGDFIDEPKTIQEIITNFRINYAEKTDLKRNHFEKNNLLIIFKFWDTNNNEITQQIKIELFPKK